MSVATQPRLAHTNEATRAALAAAQNAYKRASAVYKSDRVRWKEARSQLLKSAAFGENENPQFEQAFGSIAFTYLNEKAPGLMPYVLGFQLLDRVDGGKKAVGAFVAKVGDKIIDIPMFFDNGELKGHQLMRLRSPELFIPLREGFLDFLFSKMPQDLGEVGPRINSQSSVKSTPSMRPFDGSRYMKAGAVDRMHDWAKEAELAEQYAAMKLDPVNLELGCAMLDKKQATHVDLQSVLSGSYDTLKTAAAMCDAYPRFRHMLDRHLGEGWLVKAAESLPKAVSALQVPRLRGLPKLGAKTAGTRDLQFVTQVNTRFKLAGHRDTVADEISRYGVFIDDSRASNKLAEAYEIESQATHICAPDEPDTYTVVDADGSSIQAMVWPAMYRLPSTGMDLLLDLKSKRFVEADRNNYVAFRPTGKEVKDPGKARDIERTNKRRPGEGDVFFVYSSKTQITGPFFVTRKVSADRYEVDDVGGYLYHVGDTDGFSLCRSAGRTQISTVVFTKSPGNSAVLGGHRGTLTLPATSRVLVIGRCASESLGGLSSEVYFDSSKARDEMKLQLMNREDIRLDQLGKFANLSVMVKSAGEVVVNDVLLKESQARTWLITRMGLSKTCAEALVNGPKHIRRFIVSHPGEKIASVQQLGKLAYYTPELNFPETQDPYDSESGAYQIDPAQQQFEQAPREPSRQPLLPWEDPQGTGGGSPGFNDDMQAIEQQDNEDIMSDMVGLISLLRNSRIDNSLRQTSKALLSAVDKLGRQIFLFHSHTDEFAEAFGSEEVDDLEASMVTCFEAAGDLFLELSRKGPDPHPELDIATMPSVD